MKTTVMKCFFLLLFLSTAACSFAQLKETIHLHTDKDIYLSGETIWFKAYIFSENLPSRSTNLYAGLYDLNGKLLYKKHFPVFEGAAQGDFEISDTLLHQALQLRIFTKNMIAYDSNNAVIKVIYVYQKYKQAGKVQPALNDTMQLHFFPEGGTLVAGIINYMGFKAQYSNGIPAVMNGILIESNDNRIIDSVNTDQDGLGRIQFIPQYGKQYAVSWENGQGKIHQYILPPSDHVGAVLHTDIHEKKLYYSIQKNNNFPRFDKLHLTYKIENDTIYKETVALNNISQFINNINIDSFPAGIVKMILSDDKNNLLQQKLIYIPAWKKLPEIKVIEKNMTAKGKVVLEIYVPDSALHTLSLSIADPAFYDPSNQSSIYDDMLLPGKIQSHVLGNAIHSGNHKKTDLALLSDKISLPLSRNPVTDDYLSLAIKYHDKNYPLSENSSLMLIISDKGTGNQILTVNRREKTIFNKSGLVFYDSARIYFQMDNNKEVSKRLSLISPVEMKIPQTISSLVVTDQTPKNIIPVGEIETYREQKQNRFNEMQTIKTVIVKSKYVNPVTKRMLELDEKYASSFNRGIGRGYQLNALDDHAENYSDVFSYIAYRIPGLQTAGTFGSRYIRNTFRGGTPLLFINETESPQESLESIAPSELAYVKFIPGIVIATSSTTADGALYIYLKKGDEPNPGNRGLRMAWAKGYSTGRDFPIPDYNEKTNMASTDYRSTLYWNPYIITDKSNNKIRVEYYNNDIAKKHLVILKGFSADGTLVEMRKIIE